MAWTQYYHNDLDDLDTQIAKAAEYSQELRKAMKAEKPELLYLNSYATAVLNLKSTLASLEDCTQQVKKGRARLQKMADRKKKATQLSRVLAGKKRNKK